VKGWIEAKHVSPGKWWYATLSDLPLEKVIVGDEPNRVFAFQSGAMAFTNHCGGLFWQRGRPNAGDPRWSTAEEAVREWGKDGGSKGWWQFFNEPFQPQLIVRVSTDIDQTCKGKFIHRGRPNPPLPKREEAVSISTGETATVNAGQKVDLKIPYRKYRCGCAGYDGPKCSVHDLPECAPSKLNPL
jgi:hypothetical protein